MSDDKLIPVAPPGELRQPARREPYRVTARALLLGERLDTIGLERSDMIAAAPLAFRVGPFGYAALFRFGVAVLVGLSPLEEDDFLGKIRVRVSGKRDHI